MKDTADVDVDDAVPVLDRGVPQISELLDACVVHQQPDRSEIAVCAFGELLAVRSGRARRIPRRRRCRPPRSTRRVARRRTDASTSASTTVMPNAAACRARPAPMPAPAPVMTATPPPKMSPARRLRSCHDAHALAAAEFFALVFGERNRIFGVENDTHRREHQSVLAAPDPDVDDTAGHVERDVVGDLVDVQVEADSS